MIKSQTITGKLTITKRLPSSNNGNPRYLMDIGGIECQTKVDSGLAYVVPNFTQQTVRATIAPHYGKVSLININGVE